MHAESGYFPSCYLAKGGDTYLAAFRAYEIGFIRSSDPTLSWLSRHSAYPDLNDFDLGTRGLSQYLT